MPFLVVDNKKFGKSVISFDEEDATLVLAHTWHIVKTSNGSPLYAQTCLQKTIQYMHRLLLDAPKGMQVDHRDGDGLNNRRKNLRLCTNNQNQLNKKRRRTNTSGYVGVSRHKNKWRARLMLDKKEMYLGTFEDKIEAALAYDEAAKKYFGEFARLNFGELDVK